MADMFVGQDQFIGDDDDDAELEDVFAGDDELEGDYDDDDDDDEVGLDEIVGAIEMLGAARRRPRRRRRRGRSKSRNLARTLATVRAAGGVALRRKKPTGQFEQPLPIPPTSFLVGQALDIELRPQRTFEAQRLVIDSTIAPFFRILDLKIGQNTQFVASGALPASIFSEVAVGVRLRGGTANLGNTIVLSAQNIDTVATRVLSGAIIGRAVEYN
jgi:hypothetical protein